MNGTTVDEFIPDTVAAAYTAGGSLALTGAKVAGKKVLNEAGERVVKEGLEEGAEKAGIETLEAGAKRKHPGPPPKYLVLGAKYGDAELAKLTDGTRQMSDKWMDSR